MKGQVQTEFTDIAGSEETTSSLLAKPERERGHLSVDYTCMNWLSLERKVFFFHQLSLLVLVIFLKSLCYICIYELSLGF